MSVLLFITVAAQVSLMSYDIKYFTVKREFSLESLKAKSGSIPYKIYDVFPNKSSSVKLQFSVFVIQV